MAIAIKSIPILKDELAKKFNESAQASLSKKGSVNFSAQVATASKILAKAKI